MDTNNNTGTQNRFAEKNGQVSQYEKVGGGTTKRGVGRNPRWKGGKTEMRDTRYEIRMVFLGTLKEGRGAEATGAEEEREGYDDVDGSLKGNERGMMQAWVRIAAKAGDGLLPTNRDKKEQRDVRVGE